jgi:hypothetical protein
MGWEFDIAFAGFGLGFRIPAIARNRGNCAQQRQLRATEAIARNKIMQRIIHLNYCEYKN